MSGSTQLHTSPVGVCNHQRRAATSSTLVGYWDLAHTEAQPAEEAFGLHNAAVEAGEATLTEDTRKLVPIKDFGPDGKYRCESLPSPSQSKHMIDFASRCRQASDEIRETTTARQPLGNGIRVADPSRPDRHRWSLRL